MPITTVEDLRRHLQWAIVVEHTTIPPYLAALFSLENRHTDAAPLIHSVVIEEMLHLTLACNLLTAVGGTPDLNDEMLVPSYPTTMPHHAPDPPLGIRIQPVSVDVITSTFLRIEQPEAPMAPPEDDNYDTLGQFYAAISAGFTLLANEPGVTLFTGDPLKQVDARNLFEDKVEISADVVPVTDLHSALRSIEEIVEQGEGALPGELDPEGNLGHYWRFKEIADGKVPLDGVFPTELDPSTRGLPPGPLQGLSQLFNDCYGLLLKSLTRLFSDIDQQPMINAMFALMLKVLKPLGALMVAQPIPGRGKNLGPSFEYSDAAQSDVVKSCAALVGAFPELAAIDCALKALPPIDRSAASLEMVADHGHTPLRGLSADPAATPDTGRFTRLFPNLAGYEPPTAPLVALGKSGGPMDAGIDIPPEQHSKTVPAGFTYFGQFLDHNITFDADSSLDHLDDPQATTNFRSGRIDLEHVYGLGPETQAFSFYDRNDPGKFYIEADRPFDVPRNAQGTPVIADPRNDNTVITVQIHLAFMKFHNAVVDILRKDCVPEAELFAQARQLVVWHYQWIVLHEWLPLILEPSVYEDIMENGLRYYTWTHRPSIPVEFNVAAYRLHTLVLEQYRLNAEEAGTLFRFRHPFAPLTTSNPNLVIDWSYFFDFGDGKVEYAKRFEAKIVNTFLNIPGPIDNPLEWPFDAAMGDLRSIAVRNLLRGRVFGLPSGQSVAYRLGLTPLTQEELGLTHHGLDEAPLWYYVLKEAEVQTGGVTLGQVGSRIVGEVFVGLVKGDQTSFVEVAPNWTPTFGTGGKFTMVDLLKIAQGTAPAV